jgi:hypothetical protein
MKISEIEVGVEYAAIEQGRSANHDSPRQCKVLEIVAEEEPVYGQWTGTARTRKKRKVKVKFLDKPTVDTSFSSYRYRISAAKKGTTQVIEAKEIVGKWADLKDDILARIEAGKRTEELETSLELRLRKLKLSNSYVTVSDRHVRMSVMNKDVEKLLALAEKGAGLA